MGEAKVGQEFITHEFDEAIAVQECIVEAETTLSTKHPQGSAKRAIKESLREDKTFLSQLKTLGKAHDATGKIEDVAGGLKELMESTLETATSEGADSDFYEAHAVLLNIKRKQMDSAGGMLAIARETGDAELRKAATDFQKAQKASSAISQRRTRCVRSRDRDGRRMSESDDRGALIGQQPERQTESIPGGVKPDDERLASRAAAPSVPGEPESDDKRTELDRHREAGHATEDPRR